MEFWRRAFWSYAALVLVFLYSLGADEWKYRGEVELSKDEVYRIVLQEKGQLKEISFRWTLYKNEGLVLHISFDGFPHQTVLYKDYQRSGFKLPLASAKPTSLSYPYFWILFKEYQVTTKLVRLAFYLHDGGKDFTMISQGKAKSVGFGAY